jgi:hypothetical protein
MLGKKIDLLKAMGNKKPKDFVSEKFDEYVAAYSRMAHPNEKHIKDYNEISESYNKYMKREDIQERGLDPGVTFSFS